MMQEQFFDPEEFREVGLPEGEVYPGFWWVQWSGLQNHSFLVKHLHFRRSTGSTLSTEGGWLLDGLTEDPGGDFICGASPTRGGANPTLSFLPDHKGRAQTTHTDSHGEGAVTLTSLGENLIEGLTSYRLDIDRESELEAIGLLNNFLLHHPRVRLDDVSFELSAQVGAFTDKVWSIRLELNVDGVSAEALELDGVTNIGRRQPRTPRVRQHVLDMAEFEGYREFGPLDSSTPHALHMRSVAAVTEAINTPIPLDTAFLQLMKEPGEDHLVFAEEVPRALYVAALMVVGANRTGVGRYRAEDWSEANKLSRWVLGLEDKSGLVEQREMIERVFGAVASLTTTEQAETLFHAELFVSGDSETIDVRFPGLARELKYLRVDLLWRVRRDELVTLFQQLVGDEEERFQVVAESPNEERAFIFAIDLSQQPMVQVEPGIKTRHPEFTNRQHEAEYWLNWHADFIAADAMKIDLDHDLVRDPDIVAGILTHAVKQQIGFAPETMSWRAMPF